MNSPWQILGSLWFSIKYRTYRLMVERKNKRALNAENKFIATLDPKQKHYYQKVKDLLKQDLQELFYYDDHIVIKDRGVIVTIKLYGNITFMTYTSHNYKGVMENEIRFGDRTGYFLLQDVELALRRKRMIILEERRQLTYIP